MNRRLVVKLAAADMSVFTAYCPSGGRCGHYLVTILVLLGGILLQSCSSEQAATRSGERPNIVLLFADDLGYGDLGSYGHPTIRTPYLDEMARDGVRFTSFYAAPTCVPSRVQLLTGRYRIRTGLGATGANGTDGLRDEEITLAEALKTQGYRTHMVGKWHLGHAQDDYLPTSHGFDSWFGLPYSNDMQPPWVQTDEPLQLYRNTTPIEHPVDQSTLTTRYTGEALKFIEAGGEQPFFLYLAYSMPHLPIHTADRFKGQSRAGLYGDVIETIDWSAGQILETLQEQGLDDNTLVIFTSDNGPWQDLPNRMLQAGNRPWHAGSQGLLRGWKATTYEGGVRVPAIARWPGQIPAGHTSAEVASTMDLYTTLIHIAGGQVPQDRTVDGRNIMPLLTGEALSTEGEYFYIHHDRLRGVRSGEWKLHLSSERRDNAEAPLEQRSWQLFNLDVDPAERYDMADERPEVVEQLRKRLQSFMESTSAEMPRAEALMSK